MNYVWETALAADRCGTKIENIRYIPASDGSPYTEVVLENLNDSTLNDLEVQINPLYRFANQFSRMFDVNLKGHENTRLLVFDVFIHYITQLDLRQGFSRQEYFLRFFLHDILDGTFGRQAFEVLHDFSMKQWNTLMRFIVKLYDCGSSIALFREVMRCIYPNAIVYIDNDVIRQILIYLGMKETETEKNKIRLLQDMFLPINYEMYLFWEHHFGIIDVDETMVLDEMVLF